MMTSGDWITITDYERRMYNEALPVVNTYDFQNGVAKTTEVIRRLEKFGWEIADKCQDYITMINYGKLTTLFIPNSREIEEKKLLKLINKAEVSVIEFFTSV